MNNLIFNECGWCSEMTQLLSPNYDARPEPASIDLLVIHNISLPPSEFGGDWVDDLFMNRLDANAHPYFRTIHTFKVSSHFLIKRCGLMKQYVSCFDRAWHAGVSIWRKRERCNDFSIGIELEGDDFSAFTDAQYSALKQLTASLLKYYPNIQGVVAHSEIAPDRKTDPGKYFDWARYEADACIPKTWRL